jgi:hypothetical protein
MGRPRGSRNLPHAPRPEIERLRPILRALIAMAGFSLWGVRRRLETLGYDFDIHRALKGRHDLRVWQVLAVCQVIGVHPSEVFRMVLPEPAGPSPLVAEVEALVRPPKPTPLRAAVADRLLQSQGIEADRRKRP